MQLARILAIDMGITNLGLAWAVVPPNLLDRETRLRGIEFQPEQRKGSILVRQDGRVFEYKQQASHRRVNEFIVDNMDWFRWADLIVIEKQMSEDYTKEEGTECLFLQIATAGAIQAMITHKVLDAKLYVIDPKVYKRYFGLPPSPKNLTKSQKHKYQKDKAVEFYIESFGPESYNALGRAHGPKLDDLVDATLIWFYAAAHFTQLMNGIDKSDHVMEYHSNKMRFSAKERQNYQTPGNTLLPHELSMVHEVYKNAKNAAKQTRVKNRRLT
jgi:hypothetical protein